MGLHLHSGLSRTIIETHLQKRVIAVIEKNVATVLGELYNYLDTNHVIKWVVYRAIMSLSVVYCYFTVLCPFPSHTSLDTIQISCKPFSFECSCITKHPVLRNNTIGVPQKP